MYINNKWFGTWPQQVTYNVNKINTHSIKTIRIMSLSYYIYPLCHLINFCSDPLCFNNANCSVTSLILYFSHEFLTQNIWFRNYCFFSVGDLFTFKIVSFFHFMFSYRFSYFRSWSLVSKMLKVNNRQKVIKTDVSWKLV